MSPDFYLFLSYFLYKYFSSPTLPFGFPNMLQESLLFPSLFILLSFFFFVALYPLLLIAITISKTKREVWYPENFKKIIIT